MNGWLDWREIEQHNDWGAREKTDAMCSRWDEGAQMWDRRWKSEEDFTKRQADAMAFLPTDTVMDVGCGAGGIALFVAPRVSKVICLDGGRNMLDIVKSNAQQKGVDNMETLLGNFYALEPGVDVPVCDVAINRWSPAQGDILKFSRFARRYCYSISSCTMDFAQGGFTEGGMWCRSTVDEDLNHTPRPCGRKYGFNVHFNLLYDCGANPTIQYVEHTQVKTAETREALERAVWQDFHKAKPPSENRPVKVHPLMGRNMHQVEDGSWELRMSHRIAILGWDPNELERFTA